MVTNRDVGPDSGTETRSKRALGNSLTLVSSTKARGCIGQCDGPHGEYKGEAAQWQQRRLSGTRKRTNASGFSTVTGCRSSAERVAKQPLRSSSSRTRSAVSTATAACSAASWAGEGVALPTAPPPPASAMGKPSKCAKGSGEGSTALQSQAQRAREF